MRVRHFVVIFAIFLASSIPAAASTGDALGIYSSQSWTLPGSVAVEGVSLEPRSQRVWRVDFNASSLTFEPGASDGIEQRTQAIQYSEGYNKRRQIHMIASFATLPLFVGQYITGDKLYDGDA